MALCMLVMCLVESVYKQAPRQASSKQGQRQHRSDRCTPCMSYIAEGWLHCYIIITAFECAIACLCQPSFECARSRSVSYTRFSYIRKMPLSIFGLGVLMLASRYTRVFTVCDQCNAIQKVPVWDRKKLIIDFFGLII